MPSISALSPSGCHLAYAVEHSVVRKGAADPAEHLGKQQQHRPEGGADDDVDASPSLPQYRVAIESGLAANRSPIGQTSKERRTPSRGEEAGNLNTCQHCPVKASVTALQWLDDSHLACGLQDGTVVVIVAGRRRHRRGGGSSSGGSRSEAEGAAQRGRWFEPGRGQEGGVEEWTPALSRCFHRVHHGGGGGPEDKSRRVMCIRVSGGGGLGGEGAAAAAAGGATRGSEPTVWVLYPDRVLVCVGVEAVVALAR